MVIQEAKRGGQQAGQKGVEQVESYYRIASIKPVAIVKLSAFQRLFFLLSVYIHLFSFYSTLPGRGWPRNSRDGRQ